MNICSGALYIAMRFLIQREQLTLCLTMTGVSICLMAVIVLSYSPLLHSVWLFRILDFKGLDLYPGPFLLLRIDVYHRFLLPWSIIFLRSLHNLVRILFVIIPG